MKYNFDKVVNRRGTNCLKYDFAVERNMPADILPLWVADMDFPVAEEITKELEKVVAHGIYGYSDSKESYYNAVAQWMEQYHNYHVEQEWLVKTPGIVFAIATAVKAFTKEGDSIMIQSPVYYPFSQVVKSNHRVLIDNVLKEQDGRYTMDLQDFEEKIVNHQVKMFILCSPHNPVGRVWSREELQRVAEICLKHHVLVISDEIHADFNYPGYEHSIFTTVDKRLEEIAIVCTAPSKTFNLAGLQISNIFIANETLRNLFKKEINKTGYSDINTMGLAACESAYRSGREWLEELKVYLKGNLDYTREFLLQRLPHIKLVEPEGTYLLWLDCRDLAMNREELENFIVHKAGLWLDGGTMFGESGEGFQRVNIACPRSTLTKALEQLEAAYKML